MGDKFLKIRTEVFSFFAYGALVLFWLYPASLSPSDLIASLEDSDFSQALWVIERYRPLEPAFSTQAFPPKGVDFSYIHWMVVPILLAKCFSAIFGLVLAYNILTMLSLTLACYGSYLLALQVGANCWGARFAGLAYGLCPYLAGQVLSGHFYYVFGAALIPYYLLVFHRFLKGDGKRLLSGLWVVALWLLLMRTCIYYSLFLIPICSLWSISFLIRRTKMVGYRVVGSLLSCGIFLSALNIGQVDSSPDTLLQMDKSNVVVFDADLLAAITPSPYHPIWGNEFERSGDRVGFVGISLLALVLVQLVKGNERTLTALAATAWLIALGPVLYVAGSPMLSLPWARLFDLPGYASIQVYGRCMLLVQLFIALLGARAIKSRRSGVVLGAILMFEFCLFPVPTYDCKPAELFSQIRTRPPGAVASVPYRPQNTEPLYHQVLHSHSGLRAPVLRPSSELIDFYRGFELVKHLGDKEGHRELTDVLASGLQRLVDLRYIALDKERLGDSNSQAWENALSQLFEVEARWSNQKFIILEIGRLSLPEGPIDFDLTSPNNGYCAVGLSPVVERGGRNLRFVMEKTKIWVPLDGSGRELYLEGQVTGQVSAVVTWNGQYLGEILWHPGDSKSIWKLDDGIVLDGANELTIEPVPESAPIGLRRLIFRE